jgi:vacuolar-type H+-ATPase subunit I/STV1
VEKNKTLVETIKSMASRDDFHAAFEKLRGEYAQLQNASFRMQETVHELQAERASLHGELDSRADREVKLMEQHEREAKTYEEYVAYLLGKQKEQQARTEAAEAQTQQDPQLFQEKRDDLSGRYAESEIIVEGSSVGPAMSTVAPTSDQLLLTLEDTIRSAHWQLASAVSDLPGDQRADLASHLGIAVALINAAGRRVRMS